MGGGGVRSPGNLRDSWRALETGHLSIWPHCEGNLEGGSFTGDLEGYVEEGSGDGYLSLGAPLGNLEGGDSFTGDLGGYVEKALETSISFHRGPAGEPGRRLIYQGD
jgi:hypothetical protein